MTASKTSIQVILLALTVLLASKIGLLAVADAQTTGKVPVFPKYMVLGVVYAPPGSSSSVTYGSSQLVGSADSISSGSQSTINQSTSKTSGFNLFGFGSTSTSTTTSSFQASTTSTNSMSINTTNGNSIATMGPISAALGVNHDNDVIYILLDPIVIAGISYDPSSGSIIGNSSTWNGFATNGCDVKASNFTPTFAQQLYGCDPNQYPYPDIIGIPVWCLKNPYYPGQGCAQWLQYTSRAWDQSYRGLAYPGQTLAYPANPMNTAGLTLQDYADILQADPFVQINGHSQNVCHPTYGPNIDPNTSETVIVPINNGNVIYIAMTTGGSYSGTPNVTFSGGGGSGAAGIANMVGGAVVSVSITNGGSGYLTAPSVSFSGGGQSAAAAAIAYLPSIPSACGAANSTDTGGTQTPLGTVYSRFQPYGAVQYPLPGPNGLPSTYAGYFQYQSINSNSFTSNDSHSTGSSSGTSVGFSLSASAGYGFGKPSSNGGANVGIEIAGFNDSFGMQNGQTMTFQNSNSLTSTSQTTSSAAYSITGPQLSDNYSGPATYNVYLDNVYGTFAFYSDLEPAVKLGTITITQGMTPASLDTVANPVSNGTIVPFPPTAVGTPSAPVPITLTNNSSNPLTMVFPAVTFSDPGFQIVEGDPRFPDGCSNQYLYPFGITSANGLQTYYCTLYIVFDPLLSDAPNPATMANLLSIQATMIAAGTENASSYQNILVTSEAAVSGVVLGTQGATLLPVGMSSASLPSSNPIPFVYTFPSFDGVAEQQKFSFANNYSVPIYVNTIDVSNPSFAVAPGNTCVGWLQVGQTCNIPILYNPLPVSSTNSAPGTNTASNTGVINVVGSVTAPCTNTCTSLATVGTAGNGTGAVTATPQVDMEVDSFPGSSSTDTRPGIVTITNSTSYPANITIEPDVQVVVPPTTGSATFNIVNYCTNQLAAGASCTVEVDVTSTTTVSFPGPSYDEEVAIINIPRFLVFSAKLVGGNSATFSEEVGLSYDYSVTTQTGPNISIGAGQQTQTVNPGGTAQYGLLLSPSGSAYPGNVSFAASGLPVGAVASFSPSSVASNAGPVTVTMSIQVPAAKGSLDPVPILGGRAQVIVWAFVLFVPLTMRQRCGGLRQRVTSKMFTVVILVASISIAGSIVGCGGSGGSAGKSVTLPAPETYAIVVTATSAAHSQSVNLTLIVQ